MSLIFKEIVVTLQMVLLRLIYENFEGIVQYARKRVIDTCSSYYIVNFSSFADGLVVVMHRDMRSRYSIEFKNVPYPLGKRSFTINLGAGKHLVNHRVLNDVGVRLNAFIDEKDNDEWRKVLVEHALDWCRKNVTYPPVPLYRRVFGATQVAHEGQIDLVNLPGLCLTHKRHTDCFDHKNEVYVDVCMVGGIRERLFSTN